MYHMVNWEDLTTDHIRESYKLRKLYEKARDSLGYKK